MVHARFELVDWKKKTVTLYPFFFRFTRENRRKKLV